MAFSKYKKGTVLSVSGAPGDEGIVLAKITDNRWMIIKGDGSTEYAPDLAMDNRAEFVHHVNVLSPSDGYMEMDRIYSKMIRDRVDVQVEPKEAEGCFVIKYWGELRDSIDNCKSITYYPTGVEDLDEIPENAVYVPAEDREVSVRCDYDSTEGNITVVVNGPVVGINPEDIAAEIMKRMGDVL